MSTDTIDQAHSQKIRSIPYWSGSISLRPLAGGITNRNYLVEQGPDRFVARVGAELPHLGIDRRNEIECHHAAESLGVAPKILFGANGVLVSRYIESRTLCPTGGREPGFAPRLAALLRQLHDGWDTLHGDLLFFSPFQAARTYTQTALRTGAQLPPDIDQLLNSLRQLSRTIAPYIPTLCHNDMLPANVLDDGERVWLVDWEYAGMGHPLFDLAMFSACCEFSEDQEIDFLGHYLGEQPRPQQLRELRVLKAASLVREGLWAVVQTVASDLDFDYHEYARSSFDKFRSAVAKL